MTERFGQDRKCLKLEPNIWVKLSILRINRGDTKKANSIELAFLDLSIVLRDGIEPPTQGFLESRSRCVSA
jgi:hypothetical protein